MALGLLHGPVELLPVSSSAHVTALPWLLDWEVARWDRTRRHELAVALHAGTAAALLIALRRDARAIAGDRARVGLVGAALAPPLLAALGLERRVETLVESPAALAAGLVAGAAGLAVADRVPVRREAASARARDGLALGLAQAAALAPGVSRNGATLAAARARGFDRAVASRLSWEVALPVLIGASALKARRLARAPQRSAELAPLLAGAGASFVSTLAATRVIGTERRRPLWPWAVWRTGLAAAILAVRQNRGR